MSSAYVCDRCTIAFKSKDGYTKHLARKTPCQPVAAKIDEAKITASEGSTSGVDAIRREMWRARDLLRKVGVTGLEALDAISLVIALLALDKIFGDELTDATKFAIPKIGGLACKQALEGQRTRLSVLATTPFNADKNANYAKYIRDALQTLCYHTGELGAMIKPLEELGRSFALKDSRVAYDLIKLCAEKLQFNAAEDILGRGYSSVIKDFLVGKDLGQFLTTPFIIKYAVEAVQRGGRELGDVLDPTCGSGGFLASALGAISVHGYEIDPRISLIAYTNCLLAHRETPIVTRCDFLLEAPADQYDTILANPPFGIKGYKHKQVIEDLDKNHPDEGENSFPLPTSVTGLFLSRIVRVLKDGGRASVVLPLGKELSSRSPADMKFRRAFLKACKITEIVSIPGGTFDNTTIRTVLIVFDKVRDLADCIKRKGSKRITLEIDDSIPYASDEITFEVMRTDGSVGASKEIIPLVSMAEVEEKAFSLSPDDYREESETSKVELSGNVQMVKLGEISKLLPGKSITKSALQPGTYPVVGGGMTPMGSHSEQNTPAGTIILSATGASCGYVSRYPSPVFRSADAIAVELSEGVDPTFMFHVLSLTQQTALQKLRTGMAQPHLNKQAVLDLEVPLPSLEVQQRIARELDELAEGVELARKTAAHVERKMRYAMEDTLRGPDITRVKLGGICKMQSGKYNSKDKKEEGLYPFFTASAKNPCGFGDKPSFEYDEYIIFAKDGNISNINGDVGIGRAWFMDMPACGTSHVLALHSFGEQAHVRFVQKYLDLTAPNTRMQVARTLTGLGMISMERLKELEIPLPPFKIQQKLAKELDQLAILRDALKHDEAHTQARMHTHLTALLSLPPTAADSVMEHIEQTIDSTDSDEPPTDEKTDEASDEKEEADVSPGDHHDLIDDLLG